MLHAATLTAPSPVLADVAPPIRISTLFGSDNALLAEFDTFQEDELVCITWHGHLDSPAVVKVATEGLRLRQNGRSTPFVINDKSRATGEWADAMPWLEYDWLPQTVTGGLQALAYVVSDDMQTYMPSFVFYQRIRQVLPLQLFSNVVDARQWLMELRVKSWIRQFRNADGWVCFIMQLDKKMAQLNIQPGHFFKFITS